MKNLLTNEKVFDRIICVPSEFDDSAVSANLTRLIYNAASPSGKATDSDSVIT